MWRCRGGRTDGRCIPIGPMTFRACLRPFLLLLLPAQLVFPLSPPLQYGVCSLCMTVSVWGAHGWHLWDVRTGMLRYFGVGESFEESPPPENLVFTHFPCLFWLKTSDEEQCTCIGSRDAVLHLRGLCLERSIQRGWGWDTKSFPPPFLGELRYLCKALH